MFFNISDTHLENYPCHWQLGKFSVSTDNGWTLTTLGTAQILYKGYADKNSLDNLLDEILFQQEPQLTGNFCALVLVDNSIEIQTDRYRSFPIYIGHGVNNLIPTDYIAWTDSLITVHADLSITEDKFDVIGKIDTSPIALDEALDAITSILDWKVTNFLKHNQLPIKSFLSGGVDSLLVYSFLRKHTDAFELVKCSHVDYDYFWLKNSSDITRFWAYNQIHHWTEPCVLTSGAPGDEFTMRSPTTTDLFLKHHNIKISELLAQPKWADSLHYKYFSKEKHMQIFLTQEAPVQLLENLHWNLCNIVVNDWQHWHLGNTITWTPLRDLDIFKIMLRLPVDVLIEQVMNSNISIQLIERNCPGLSTAISDAKNSGNVLSNLVNVI